MSSNPNKPTRYVLFLMDGPFAERHVEWVACDEPPVVLAIKFTLYTPAMTLRNHVEQRYVRVTRIGNELLYRVMEGDEAPPARPREVSVGKVVQNDA